MIKFQKYIVIIVFAIPLLSNALSIEQSTFGKTSSKNKVYEFTLTNDTGMKVGIINYRAIITNITVPGKNNKPYDVVLGYKNLGDYLKDDAVYMNVVVGRYAGRIKDGLFTLNNQQYHLIKNDHGNTLHGGGRVGFNDSIWTPKVVKTEKSVSLILSLTTADKDQGFPGKLHSVIAYTLPRDKNELIISYHVTTDKTTVVNLSNHIYYNLEGEGYPTILDHKLLINADKTTVVDSQLIPTGQLADVSNTPFDFRKLTSIGKRINANNDQIKYGRGYDVTYVLNTPVNNKQPNLAAILVAPHSGVKMSIYTTEPSLQFYSGNSLNHLAGGKHGHHYNYRSGLVFETEHNPDSPNHANFPSTALNPGTVYTSRTILKFN
jgi:aldose 1-epimerase